MKTWYTYHLIDPRNNKVFYVGKGHGRRATIHMVRALKWRAKNYPDDTNPKPNKHLYYKLLQIHDADLEPAISIVFETQIEKEALDREECDIKVFGIKNLCNLTLGGEGETRSPESLLKLSQSLRKFWDSSDGYKLREQFSEDRSGASNPMWGTEENEEHKKQRMAPMLAQPRWNVGLKNDPRSKGPPKGNIPHNVIACRLVNDDGRVFEANSIKELSVVSGVPLISINRLHLGIYKRNKKGWHFEIISKDYYGS